MLLPTDPPERDVADAPWSGWPVVLTVMAVFIASCAAARGGFFSSADPGDVSRYYGFARQIRDGQIPYHNFYMEYPPGAIPAFLAPLALGKIAGYFLAFKYTVAVAGVALVGASARVLGLLRAEKSAWLATYVLVATSPAVLGAVVLNRYDLWPTLICVLALGALLARRDRLGFGLMALGCVVKVFPAAALPVVVLHVLRTRGRDALIRASATFGAVVAVTVLPFAVVAPGGFGYSIYTQTIRHLQLESLGSSLLLAADALGVYSAKIIPGKPGSLDLSGTLPTALGVVTLLLFLVALAAVVGAYLRAPASDELLVLGFAASVTAFVAFSKVVSPQFLIWLVPLVPLVARRTGLLASTVLFAVLVTTQIEVVYEHPLRAFGWPVWVLLARNLLLVWLFVILVRAMRSRRGQAGRPAVL